jgi:hypothetical protein
LYKELNNIKKKKKEGAGRGGGGEEEEDSPHRVGLKPSGNGFCSE